MLTDRLLFVKSYLNKPLPLWGIAILVYWISLFPARFGADTNALIFLMESGETTAHWTALYFRVFQAITLNGHAIWLGSFISISLLAISLENLLRAVSKNPKMLSRLRIIVAFSPFFGVFGMTLDHQLFTTVGFLNCLAFCLTKKVELLPASTREYKSQINLWLATSFVFLQMTFQGMFISFIFAFMFFRFKRALSISVLALVFGLTSASLLQVSTGRTEVSAAVSDLRLVPLLGDIKCVVQHPKVNLTPSETKTLSKLASLENWRDPKPCIVADNAFFALHGSSKYQVEIVKTWMSLATRYPQLILVAHLQRSSMALPPPFFRGQPNMIPTNDLEPARPELSVELHQWSEVFKTSIDNENLKADRPRLVQLLEPLPLLIAFVFNQNSQFWGWGGLWLLLAAICLVLRRREGSSSAELNTLIPLLVLSLFLFVMSPASSCRYVMPQILFGIVLTTEYLLRKTELLTEKK